MDKYSYNGVVLPTPPDPSLLKMILSRKKRPEKDYPYAVIGFSDLKLKDMELDGDGTEASA